MVQRVNSRFVAEDAVKVEAIFGSGLMCVDTLQVMATFSRDNRAKSHGRLSLPVACVCFDCEPLRLTC